jgi:hypothetical protein
MLTACDICESNRLIADTDRTFCGSDIMRLRLHEGIVFLLSSSLMTVVSVFLLVIDPSLMSVLSSLFFSACFGFSIWCYPDYKGMHWFQNGRCWQCGTPFQANIAICKQCGHDIEADE